MPDKRAIVGDLVQMNCVFSGDPIPAVSWLKDGRPISPGKGRIQVLDRGLESILQIETVADGDFGMYQCQVDSSLGTATQDFQLMKSVFVGWVNYQAIKPFICLTSWKLWCSSSSTTPRCHCDRESNQSDIWL